MLPRLLPVAPPSAQISRSTGGCATTGRGQSESLPFRFVMSRDIENGPNLYLGSGVFAAEAYEPPWDPRRLWGESGQAVEQLVHGDGGDADVRV